MRGLRDNRGVKHPHFVCSQLSFNCWQLPPSVDHPPQKKIPIFSFLFFAKMKKKFSLIFLIFFILYLDVGTPQPEDNLSNTH